LATPPPEYAQVRGGEVPDVREDGRQAIWIGDAETVRKRRAVLIDGSRGNEGAARIGVVLACGREIGAKNNLKALLFFTTPT